MTTLIVLRHGECDWNAEGRWVGRSDRPLTATGRAQAGAAARALAGVAIDAAYASDLNRALETARIVLGGRGVPVVGLPELRERDYGSWEGLLDEEVAERFPRGLRLLVAGEGDGAPDAEPRQAMRARVLGAVRRICRERPGATVLVVAHSGPVRAIHAAAGRPTAEVGHCEIAWLAADADGSVRFVPSPQLPDPQERVRQRGNP